MKKKIVIKKKFIAFLMVYLVLFTSYFSIITLSKYVGITRNSGIATVAKWEVSTDTSDNTSDTLNMTIGNTHPTYILKITSTSEVKAEYSIVLSNLPSDVEVKLDNRNTYETPNNNNTITFSNVGYINANASSNDRTITHTLTFNVPIGSSSINASEINIDVIFNQVNPTSN